MKSRAVIPVAVSVFVLTGALCGGHAQTGDASSAGGLGAAQNLTLTPSQRKAIYDAVARDRSKAAKPQFAPQVGAAVPPMIELYPLPDQILQQNRAANYYEYTLIKDKVVLVDPTRMRVVDVIGPEH